MDENAVSLAFCDQERVRITAAVTFDTQWPRRVG
jgi:hypothetical protein